jgi:hypothetical protein
VGLATRYFFLSECCSLKFAVLFLWGALSDDRTGLQFAVYSLNGPSHAEPVTIPYSLIWDCSSLKGQVPVFISPIGSRCYFTTDSQSNAQSSQSHITTDGQSVIMSRYRAHSGTCDRILFSVRMLFSEICCLAILGRPLWREVGSVICLSLSSNLPLGLRSEVTLRLKVGQSVCLDVEPTLGLAINSVWISLCCLCWTPSLTRGRLSLVSHCQQ